MGLIDSKEFFINLKSVPDKKSVDYDAFFAKELEKITYGVTIDGVFIHGWLYWHLNHWNIYINEEDKRDNTIIRKFTKPQLRDNEFIIAEHVKMAEEQKKGLMIFGSRRLGKSEFEASWIGRAATIYEGSENVIGSTNEKDLGIITSKIDKGLSNLHPYFRHGRLKDNWIKEVSLGYKDKKGVRYEFSKIAIRNLDGGRATEAFAGLTPKTLIIDEVGKDDWSQAFAAAIPAFTSEFGWRCTPILTGTGGTLRTDSDAEKFFKNPESRNFLGLEYPNKKGKYGLFISGIKRMEGKVETNFGTYLKNEKGIFIPENSELYDIKFFNTDESKARAIIQEELEQALKDNDPKAYLKQRMYFPEDPDDCFLTDDGNDFPVEALKEHLSFLELSEKEGENVILYRDGSGRVCSKPAPQTLKPVMEFPIKKDTIKNAPIVIYEYPKNDIPPYGLYISGADPYNQSQSVNSESLGSIYIYKRIYDVSGGTYQDSIVASYTARPETMGEWHDNAEMLLEFYNAVCMPENEGGTFIQHFDQKNKSHMLADGVSFLKSIAPNTSIQGRTKGLPATTTVQKFWMNLIIEYLKEKVQVGEDPETKIPIFKMGLIRIPDKALLKEFIAFRKDKGNYDRIFAFGHTLACNVYFNKIVPVVKMEEESEKKEDSTIRTRSPFMFGQHNPFGSRKMPF